MLAHISTATMQSTAGEVIVVSFLAPQITGDEAANELAKQFAGTVQHARVLMNLGNLEMLGSAAVGKLIWLNRKVRAAGGQLKMCGMRGRIKELMARLRLDRLFDAYETEGEALQSFSLN